MTKYLDLHGQLLGEYRLVQWLGGGRYGDVYLGQHIHHQAQAAIKVFNTPLKEQEQQSFLQEAQALQLEHSHIAPLLDTGIAANDLPYVVMEYAAHGTLRKQYIRGLQLPLATILAYITPLASALHHAHTLDLIHGNVKPENVLLDDNQTIRLSDFSIATITSRIGSSQKASPYVAPEQLLGEPDTASDQYALAVMVYEWLSGKYPFQEVASSTPQSLCEQIPDLPAEIEQILFRALAHDPGQRFASVQAFAAALKAASYEEQSPTAPMPTASLMTKKLAINAADTLEEASEQEDVSQEAVSPLAAPEAETTELETLPAPPTIVPIASVNKRHILAITVVALALLIVASSIFLPPIRNMQITDIPLKIQQNYLNAQETTTVGKMPGDKPSPAITPTPTRSYFPCS